MDLKDEEFFNYLCRLQSDRLDEQRCPLPLSMEQNSSDDAETFRKSPERKEPIEEVLLAGKPYPLVVLPVNGDYWQEGTNHVCQFDKKGKQVIKPIEPSDLVIEDDVGYCNYKNFFKGQEHYNYTGECSLGPLLLSVKFQQNCAESKGAEGDIVRIILRSSERTIQGAIAAKELPTCPGPSEIVRKLQPDLLEDFGELQLQPVIYPKASSLITRFDEHGHAEKFKVGVIYQKAQQTEEGQYFSNKSHSKAMYDFLQILGEEVELFGFKGYSGGLDTKNHQTGRKSIYTTFKGREIMFHVSTMLPFTTGDSQQLQRKRHIGNDIIAIVFQDENTPFCPSSVRSSFLHIFIVVQIEDAYSKNTRYKITVTAKEDVPEFGPSLPNPAVFYKNDPLLRDFLLTKLLNAELAAFKAKQFSTLMERTRRLLFEDLVSTLSKKSQEMLTPNTTENVVTGQSRGRLLSSLRNAFKSENYERYPPGMMRARSMENLLEKSDEETEKLRKKKKSQIITRRHLSLNERTFRKPIRPKSKSVVHAFPPSPTDLSEEKNADNKPRFFTGSSPVLPVKDLSTTIPSSPSDTPIKAADLPRAFATSLIIKNPGSVMPNGPETPETFIAHIDEAALHQKKVNGLNSSPRLRKKGIPTPESDVRLPSPIANRKIFDTSNNESFTTKSQEQATERKLSKDHAPEALVEALRGDIYKLTGEKARLQRENEALREDVKAIKEAMIKQAEDLCESQYQLTLIRATAKRKGQLTSSAV